MRNLKERSIRGVTIVMTGAFLFGASEVTVATHRAFGDSAAPATPE